MASTFLSEIGAFGATEHQLVDLEAPDARALRFVDLMRTPEAGRAPVVVEAQGQPLIYIFDGTEQPSSDILHRWLRRIAFRGDADWLGVLRPGRLDIHPAVLDEQKAPSPIEDLPDGEFRIPSLLYRSGVQAPSVRSRLRSLLFASLRRARVEFGLSPHDSLALVGGALFWRFLLDRDLLDGLEPAMIAPRAQSWEGCIDNKSSGLATFRWLDKTFNGGLLEFETPREDLPAEVFARVAGDIAHKTDAHGQLSLPEKWAQVDFAHVPIGLLSEVYEAVAHDRDKSRATEKGLFYTPRHIAEYVIAEVLDALRDLERPRLLDPAAGAGVFLVAAFRALVVREWSRTGARPGRNVVRRILEEQLVGYDIDGDALRLAELALYLTAIELDPEDKPSPLEVLRFVALRGTVLVEKSQATGLGSLGPVPKAEKGRFDAVIGNPPWTALTGRRSKNNLLGRTVAETKKAWVEASRSIVEERLGSERADSFDFPDANPDLPFVYRAMEWAKPGAVIGLLTHARWLFLQSPPAKRARRDLLEAVHVTGILNGSALRMTKVWPNVDATFCILFAANESPPAGAAFQFVSPELESEDLFQDRLRIDWTDSEAVEVEHVVARPWVLKTFFRGTSVDESVVEDVCRRGRPLGDYLKMLGTKLANGYQSTESEEAKPPPDEMKRLPDLGGAELEFLLDTDQLGRFQHEKLHRSRKPAIYRSPLLIVHESMVVDRRRPRSGLALRDVAFDERFDGASFAEVANGTEIASYLQIVLQSELFTHILLMLDGQFGVEREVVHLETINRFPVIPWADLTSRQRERVFAISQRLYSGADHEVLHDIDDFAARLYNLTNIQQQAISDTVATQLPTAEATKTASRCTTPAERKEFSRVCEESLGEVLEASGLAARVRVRDDLPVSLWRFIQVDRFALGASEPEEVNLPVDRFLKAADEGAASLVKLRLDRLTTLVALLDRYRYWTRTRARLLVSTLLAES